MKRERVLVTGGTGFLGRRLVERLLAGGREVSVLGRTPAPDLEARGVRFIRAPLDHTASVRDACRDVGSIFHVAAKVGVWGRHEDYFRANVLGTRALLEGSQVHGVRYFIHTSTPSVVYNGWDLAGVDESLPLTHDCPSAYALTKAVAERDVLAANSDSLRTIALRPHLIWGVGDPHLVPRILARARRGRLRIVGDGRNRVDMVHVDNAVDAHLRAEQALAVCHLIDDKGPGLARKAAGKAYFITNGEPVVLWDWINHLLRGVGIAPVTKKIPLATALRVGSVCECLWRILPVQSEPPMTRFVAAELAKDHWFDITAARRDLGYNPHVTMAAGTAALIAALKNPGGTNTTQV